MQRGHDQVTEDPGDDSVVLRAYIRWHAHPMQERDGGSWGSVVIHEGGTCLLLVNLARGKRSSPRRQHHFIPVDIGVGRTGGHWELVRLGPGVWDVSP